MEQTFKEKYDIKRFFRYKEKRTGQKIEFGWEEVTEILLPAVVAFKENENNAAPVSDYERYFKSLLGKSISEVISEYRGNPSGFFEYWKKEYPQYTQDHAEFVFGIGTLLLNKTEFSYKDQIFKLLKD
jgi:hypothetical protein